MIIRLCTLLLAGICFFADLAFAQRPQCVSKDVPAKLKAEAHSHNHLRPKDDIDAIGSRNISGTRFGDWYSVEKEMELGKQYSSDVESTSELIRDPTVTEYVNRIGQNLVRHSDAKVPFTIKVMASEEINAFALPGGFLYVNSGLILFAENEAELAAVMAHEIAHVAARHATRQMTRSHMFSMASVPLVFVSGGAGMVLQEAMDIATPLGKTKFSRNFEREADYLGVEYVYKAGYDPEAFVSFFERIEKSQRRRAGRVARAFSTHPQTSDRVIKIQSEIEKVLPARSTYVLSTSEFDEIKSRLYEMENGPRRTAKGGTGQPTLRRRTSPDSENHLH